MGHKRKMERLFISADVTKDGRLSRKEVHALMTDGDVRQWWSAMEFPDLSTPDKIDKLIAGLDSDSDGYVNITELTQGILRYKGAARSADVAELLREANSIRTEVQDIRTRLAARGTHQGTVLV